MMEAVIASILVTLVFVEVVYRVARNPKLKPALASVQIGLTQFRNASTDDERQELLLRVGTKTLLLSTIGLIALVALGLIAFAPMYYFDWDDSAELTYLVSLTVLSIVWFVVRVKAFPSASQDAEAKKKMSEGSYTLLDRCLHHVALGSTVLRKAAFDLDKSLALPEETPKADRPVYVCGLARSGTTMLLRILDRSDAFRSLSYRDMPFVMAPNLWKKIARVGEREALLEERAHGDGVFVGYDSPEAFEEVFWQSFDEPGAAAASYGMPAPSAETLEAFAEYRTLVANPKGADSKGGNPAAPYRYLSKNNNNVLRLKSLCTEASATILLVYRDPVATARSLYSQHQRFTAAQQDDPFTLKYMTWLGHHEFGLAHKPFSFARETTNPALKPDQPDYWLDYWNAVHRYLLAQEGAQIYLIHHDTMLQAPEAFLSKLFDLLDVQLDVAAAAAEVRAPKSAANADEFSPELVGSAYRTYESLLAKNNNLLVTRGS
jgi:hypothetical protein